MSGLTSVDQRQERAHVEATSMATADVAGFLQDALGQRLVAFMAGISDHKAVGRWAKGVRRPQPQAEARLRTAYQVFVLVQKEESPHTVRAWFTGLNPRLGDVSPADAIREGHAREVVNAARAFLASGC